MKKLLLLLPFVLLLSACSHYSQSYPYYTPEEEGYHQMTEAQKMRAAGYRKADRPAPRRRKLKEKCIDVNGQNVCGYDCKQAGGHAKCAKRSDQRCVTSHTGQIACGYSCKSTGTSVACGKYRYDNCVANAYGSIRCGNNCYEREDGEVVCGK